MMGADRGEAPEFSPVKRALVELRGLRARLSEVEARGSDPIAVVGMSIRAPGGVVDIAGFERLLWDGTDAITDVPHHRWSTDRWFEDSPDIAARMSARRGGFLADVAGFDAEFFGIAPVEAASMDPQQRLALELAWEAIEHAGIAPGSLAGTRTGVYLGIANSDYARRIFSHPDRIDPYFSSGTAYSVAAGRIAYVLDLRGPAVAIDTACSSSLVALHLACHGLRQGDCDVALVGGVNLMLSPELSLTFSRASMLSASGRCHAFDASADGYVRGEGGGFLLLRRLSESEKKGDRILAVVRGTAINQDGRSHGLTAPNGPAQQDVIRAALATAAVPARLVGYVEAHGTGTPLGDPIEAGALSAVLSQGRTPGAALMLGTVKTNVGHLEAAAGMAGVIKTVIALGKREIPPNLHFAVPNPLIDWDTLPLTIPTSVTPWSPIDGRWIAGVSAFGFSGTNAHAVLEAAPTREDDCAPRTAGGSRDLHVLALSARQASALHELAAAYRDGLRQCDPASGPTLGDVCRSATGGRSHFSHRLSVSASSMSDLGTSLGRWLDGEADPHVVAGVVPAAAPRVAFLFPGDGPLYVQMGRHLHEGAPAFRDAFAAAAAALQPFIGRALAPMVFPDGVHDTAWPAQTSSDQPARFAIAYALAALWRSWGVEPVAVMGHGVGEYVAATVAGVLSLDDAARLVAARGRVSASVPDDAQMTLGEISDDDRVERDVAGARCHPPAITMISSLTGEVVDIATLGESSSWHVHPRQPFRFAHAIGTLAGRGITHYVEMSAHPVLLGIGAECVSGATWLPSLRLGEPGWSQMLRSLQILYAGGQGIAWDSLYAGQESRRVALPTYPFQRRRHWVGDDDVSSAEAGVLLADPWAALVRRMDREAERGPLDLDPVSYPAKWECLDRVTDAQIRETLRALGAFRHEGERQTLDSLLGVTGIVTTHGPLVARWLERLTAAGVVLRDGDTYVAAPERPRAALPDLWAEALHRFADNREYFDYVRHCAAHLAAIVTGKESALESLFPGGSFDLAIGLYERSATMRYANGLAAAAVESVAQGRPAYPLRVLEVGGGSGGTTLAVLAALPSGRVRYRFTDVSGAFLDAARVRCGAHAGFETSTLDLDVDLVAQGYAPGSVDIIVAANAVHTARDLPVALQRLRDVLAPGGILVLLETTTHHGHFDITTGLMEGWQHFADALRADVPLLPPHRWVEALRAAGFSQAQAWPPEGSPAQLLAQHVIVAQAPGGLVSAGAAQRIDRSSTDARRDPPASVAGVSAPAASRTRVLEALPSDRQQLLIELVREQVVRILRLTRPEAPGRHERLMDLGMDSLMAIQLRDALNRSLALEPGLPSTLMFDYPTIEAIAEHLVGVVAQTPTTTSPPDSAGTRPWSAAAPLQAADIAMLSDEEIARLLVDQEGRG